MSTSSTSTARTTRTDDNMKIKTALLSVWDKTGIVELATALVKWNVRILSTGGTAKTLRDAGIAVTDISEVTNTPEAFGGRMKTISFQIASGILFDRDRDREEAERLKILPIDLVVANLYPFAEYKEKNLPLAELIEYIDIGGPTMIRAAAKNFAHVAVLTKAADYTGFIDELDKNSGSVGSRSRKALMKTAFRHTADYDMLIAAHLEAEDDKHASTIALRYENGQTLRYGENPHQNATFYPDRRFSFETLGGKELSYNNIVDLDAALAAVRTGAPATPTVAIVKHENPCGLATGETLGAALATAWASDTVSAFGSVIAMNAKVTRADLAFLNMDDKSTRKFVEIVAAPDFDADAVAYLQQNKNLRVLRIADMNTPLEKVYRVLQLGLLAQDADKALYEGLEIVSERKPSGGALDAELVNFGLHAVKCLKSNAIAVVRRTGKGGKDMQLLGMGAGQPNRVKSTELCMAQTEETLRQEAIALGIEEKAHVDAEMAKAYLTSDAFFPFADGPEIALSRGIRTIIEPGGSVRDPEVIAAANKASAVLVFTKMRHFKH